MVVLPSSKSSIILLPINIEMITVVRTITMSALTRNGFGLIPVCSEKCSSILYVPLFVCILLINYELALRF